MKRKEATTDPRNFLSSDENVMERWSRRWEGLAPRAGCALSGRVHRQTASRHIRWHGGTRPISSDCLAAKAARPPSLPEANLERKGVAIDSYAKRASKVRHLLAKAQTG